MLQWLVDCFDGERQLINAAGRAQRFENLVRPIRQEFAPTQRRNQRRYLKAIGQHPPAPSQTMQVYPGKHECLVIRRQRRVIDPEGCLVKRALNHAIEAKLIQLEGCRACHGNLRQVDLHHRRGLPSGHRKPKICLPLGCKVPLQPLRQIGHTCAAETAL